MLPPGSALTNNDITGRLTASPSFIPDSLGEYTLSLEVSDGDPAFTPNPTLDNVVVKANAAPEAVGDSYAVTRDTTLNVPTASGLLANDVDLNQDDLIVVRDPSDTGPTNGTLTLTQLDLENGSFSYVPNPGFEGTDSFTYRVNDRSNIPSPPYVPNTISAPATVNITVNPPNRPPVPTGGPFMLAENSANGTAVGTVAANDPDAGQTHTFAITGGNTGGAFAINSTGAITVENSVALDFETTPSFNLTVQATDNGTPTNLSGTATVTVNLTDANDPPIVAPATFSLAENSANAAVVGTVTATDIEAGQTRTFSITAGNIGGAFAINANSGQITVANSAALDFETTPSFSLTVRATDNGVPVQFGTATVIVNLTNVNEAPVINSIPGNATEEQFFTYNATRTDVDSTGQTWNVVVGTDTCTGSSINSVTGVYGFTPTGPVPPANCTLAIQVCDGGTPNLCATQITPITITAVNDAPIINSAAPPTATEDTLYSYNATRLDLDGPGQAWILAGTHTCGGAVVAGTGVFTFTPAGPIPPASCVVALQVCDTGTPNLCVTQSTTVTITPVNDPPVARIPAPSYTGNANLNFVMADDGGDGAGGILDLLDGAADPDGATTLSLVAGTIPTTAGGSVTVNTNGSFSYQPPAGFVGNDTFTYQIQDNGIPLPATTTNVVATISLSDTDGAGAGTSVLWFIDEDATSSTNIGTQANPFRTLAAFNAANAGTPQPANEPDDNDFIFLNDDALPLDNNGDGAGIYGGGITLRAGQRLIGDGSSSTLAAITGITLGSFNSLVPFSNTDPIIAGGIALNSGNTLRGIIGGSTIASGFSVSGGAVGNLTISESAINNGTGGGISITASGALTVTLDSLISTGGTNGINLIGTTGNFTANDGAISGSTGTAFNVTGGTANITYAGTINKDTGTIVSVSGTTGGSKTLLGAITDGNDGDGNGVSLTSNTGTTINIQGGLVLSTGANPAFTATGGGTVNVTGTGNTITSTTGRALNVANTTIGASGLTFQSISANGAVNGILLNNTGSGGLTVTGNSSGLCGGRVTPSGTVGVPPTVTTANSADCTGGTIQSTTGDAISLTNAANVSLTRMRILNISGANNGGIDGNNLGGSNFFRNSQMDNVASDASNGNGISLINTTTPLTLFSVEDSFFANSPSQTSHVLSSAQGSGNVRLDVRRSIFQNLVALAVQSNAGDVEGATHTVTTNIVDNVFRNASINNGQGSMAVTNAEQSATHNFTVSNNLLEDLIKGIAGGNAEILLTQTVGGGLNGTVSGNILGTATAGNGDRRGLGTVSEPDISANGELGSVDIIYDGNTVDRLLSREGGFVDLREDTQNSELIVRNNNFGQLAGFQGQVGGNPDKVNGAQREALDIQTRGEVTRTLNMLVSNNNIRANTSVNVVNLEANIDNTTPGNLTMHATVTGNTFKNDDASGGPELIARPRDAGAVTTLCLDMSGNTLDGGAGQIDLNETGVLNVEQASQALLASGNTIPSGNVLVTGGVPDFGVICSNPPN